MIFIAKGVLTLLAVLTSVAAWPQFPLPDEPAVPGVMPNDPFHTFVDHFSSDRVGTDILLQTRFNEIFSNDTVTVTQDYQFNLFRYAAEQPHKVIIRPLEDVESIKQVVFFPSIRKRDGDGVLAESVTFAGYQVAYEDEELKVFVAQWVDGFSSTVQWHLVGDPNVAKKLLRDTMAWCTTIRDAILVFDQGYWQADHALWEAVHKASWDDVILDKEFKNRLTADYRSFFKSEKTYKDLQVPWKRGLVFLGPPGNGKTISLKAIMNEIKYPALYVKSFHSWGGDQMGIREIFQRARAEAPCVLVMEDLDSLINDDNRSFFLNEVDGLEDNDGLLMIGTTNHFDRLDPALSSRPSRFDRKYTFADPKRPERRAYAVYWQNKLKDNKNIDFPDELVDQVADRTSKFSFAYLKEAFVSTLLTLAGRDDDPKNKGHDFAKVLLDEIKRLREQLEEDEDQIRRFMGNPRKGFRIQPARQAKIGSNEHRSKFDLANDNERPDQVPQINPTSEQVEKMVMRGRQPQVGDSHCLDVIMRIDPDGKEEFISRDEVPSHILAQMQANAMDLVEP